MNNSPPFRVVSYAEADRIVREHSDRLASRHPPESVGLLDSLGRVLAEAVPADRDQPPFPRSTRDGFACRAADWRGPLPLEVVGSIRAGDAESIEVTAGKAVEIMTGAPVPSGADCVVMVEHVQRDGDTLRLSPGRSIAPGDNIVPMGAEARAGDAILTGVHAFLQLRSLLQRPAAGLSSACLPVPGSPSWPPATSWSR